MAFGQLAELSARLIYHCHKSLATWKDQPNCLPETEEHVSRSDGRSTISQGPTSWDTPQTSVILCSSIVPYPRLY